LTVPIGDEDLQPSPRRPNLRILRLRALQAISITGCAAMTAFVPALGTPMLVGTSVLLIWVERSSK
jgi:hypothetical protein